MSSEWIEVDAKPYQLHFRFPFRIAHGMRTGTDALLVRVKHSQHVGYGEASFPPYLVPTQQSSMRFFEHPLLKELGADQTPQAIFDLLNQNIAGEMPAKAALDMALWQMHAIHPAAFLGEKPADLPTPHTYTLGISSLEEMEKKMGFALDCGYTFFKLKLDGLQDRELIAHFRKLSQAPFAVDANQAWKNLDEAKRTADFLEKQGALLIEQPFEAADLENSAKLKAHTILPIVADESCQVESDVATLAQAFSGINIKLHKCGGLTPAVRMMLKARELNMKILVGCMSEGPVGCAAAELIAPWADWADLDGVVLNQPVPLPETFFN
jgi:L-alanine-DL-glutamate epimerase-like enolase superfamily enzyme